MAHIIFDIISTIICVVFSRVYLGFTKFVTLQYLKAPKVLDKVIILRRVKGTSGNEAWRNRIEVELKRIGRTSYKTREDGKKLVWLCDSLKRQASFLTCSSRTEAGVFKYLMFFKVPRYII